jgi:pyruvate kinase
MLSAESATGSYPVEATRMLARIAAAIEPHRGRHPLRDEMITVSPQDKPNLPDIIALAVATTFERITPDAVIVPTHSGTTARRIARFRLPVWVVGISRDEKTCQNLCFSYGVFAVHEPDHPSAWRPWILDFLGSQGATAELVVLTEGPSHNYPERNNRLEVIDLNRR